MCECRRSVTARVAIFSRLWPCVSSHRVYATAMPCPGPPKPYGAVNCVVPCAYVPGRFWYVPLGLCIARQTTAYLHTPASSALAACWTAPPMLTVSTWSCHARCGILSIAIFQLTDTIVMPSTIAWPVAGSSGYVARPSMSDIFRPESSTAPLTASSAWAASGISAERVTFENPTPLTAILHRCSHMPIDPPKLVRRGRLRAACEAELRQRDVVVELVEDHFYPPPDLRLRIGCPQKIPGQQRPRRVVELDDDARVGDGRRESLVPRVIHDRVRIDRALAAHGLELEIDAHALHARRIRRMLEVLARLAALQGQYLLFGGVPEGPCQLVWHGDRPGHLAPVAHAGEHVGLGWSCQELCTQTRICYDRGGRAPCQS